HASRSVPASRSAKFQSFHVERRARLPNDTSIPGGKVRNGDESDALSYWVRRCFHGFAQRRARFLICRWATVSIAPSRDGVRSVRGTRLSLRKVRPGGLQDGSC